MYVCNSSYLRTETYAIRSSDCGGHALPQQHWPPHKHSKVKSEASPTIYCSLTISFEFESSRTQPTIVEYGIIYDW